jgi:radical SAM superfamily enzyme YgiQ (UPF0313 family)
VVGISAKSPNFASARIVARIAKDCDPQTTVIVGGPHASMAGGDVLRHPEIDRMVTGEGEATLVELLHAIQHNRGFAGVRGVAYRENGAVIETPRREMIQDLDSLCFPHESAPDVLKDFSLYPRSALDRIFASRGCPYDCFFCGSHNVWTRKVRRRSFSSIVCEINALRSWGVREIHFADDTFGVSKERIVALSEALAKHCPGLRWSCELHVNLISPATVAAMKNAGCHLIQVGIESGNNEILKQIRKGFTID